MHEVQGAMMVPVSSWSFRQTMANVLWGLTTAAITTGVLFYFEGRPVSAAPMAGGTTGFVAAVRY